MVPSQKNPPVPVIILTGFLGSGKTSFLSHMLSMKELSNTAVIINEFGEYALDHLLVEHVSDQLHELPGGCLCCHSRGRLVDKMLELERERTGKHIEFERLVIETSGIADTGNLVAVLWNNPQIRQTYHLDKIVTVVSASEWSDAFANTSEFPKQLALSDIVVVSKSDLLEKFSAADKIGQLISGIKTVNSGAEILFLPVSNDDLVAALNADTSNHGRDISAFAGDHDTKGYNSLTLTHSMPIPEKTITSFMTMALSRYSGQILRAKGLALTSERPDWPLVIQSVGPTFSPPVWLKKWPLPPATRLTVIYTGNTGNQITGLFESMMDIPNFDQPDRRALLENPLSVTGLGNYDPTQY